MKWLSLHHQKCGGLFGVVPLVRGMPVHLTQHVDRSDKALLKQRVGTLVGWDLHDEEETPPTAQDHHLSYMPKCVYVQFYDEDVQGNKTPCKWTVGSLTPGVYPIDPDRQDWYVDGDKQNRVARRQFPLSPHFANTVYSSQGLTIGTGVVDLKVGRNTDATTLCVAISRFRRANHLLILQPFDIEVLQQGEPERRLRSCWSTWSSWQRKTKMRHDSGQTHMVSKCEHSAHPSARRIAGWRRTCRRRRGTRSVGGWRRMLVTCRRKQERGSRGD